MAIFDDLEADFPYGGVAGAGLATSFVGYPAIYLVLYPLLAGLLPGAAGYKACSEPDKAEWKTRVVSNIHAVAVVAGVLGPMLDTESSPFWQDRVGAYSHRMAYFIGVLVGYFVCDFAVVLRYRATISGFGSTCAHHFFGIIVFGLVLYLGGPQFWAAFFIIAETSTPFVNQRWFMAKCGATKSTLYLVNGLLMVLIFGAVRVWHLPYSMSLLLEDMDGIEAKFGNFRHLLSGVAVFNIGLQSFWWYLMVKGALKALGVIGSSKKKKT